MIDRETVLLIIYITFCAVVGAELGREAASVKSMITYVLAGIAAMQITYVLSLIGFHL